MRVTLATDADDTITTIVIGFTRAEFDLLRDGNPSCVEGKLLGVGVNVAIFGGDDDDDLMKNIQASFNAPARTAAACPSCAAEWGLPYEPLPGVGAPLCRHTESVN